MPHPDLVEETALREFTVSELEETLQQLHDYFYNSARNRGLQVFEATCAVAILAGAGTVFFLISDAHWVAQALVIVGAVAGTFELHQRNRNDGFRKKITMIEAELRRRRPPNQ